MASVGGDGDDADVQEVVGVAEVFAEPLQRRLQQGFDTVDHHLVTLRLTWVERSESKGHFYLFLKLTFTRRPTLNLNSNYFCIC